MDNIRIKNIKNNFKKIYNRNCTLLYQAPGRVNLIGEHTDYNGGFVLPVAIDRCIAVAAKPNNENILRLHSLDFNNTVSCKLNNIKYDINNGWANYPLAVAKVLQEKGFKIKGADLVFEGNIPQGSGLSSSAAIEVVSCITFASISGLRISKKELPVLCQKAENDFIGVKCGIMDQFVITNAKKNSALFLDCRNLKYQHIPFNNKNISIVIANTKLKRKLVNSAYNERRKQCEEGVKILKYFFKNIKMLRDITTSQFEKYKFNLPSIIRNRCEHVVYENERVINALRLLKKNKINEFGILMNESHESLKNLYEVSCKELDALVYTAQKVEGVLGSRMTGAGFGGCTVTLIKNKYIDKVIKTMTKEYQSKFGIKPEFYISQTENGAGKI
ncbi:MAG: galactokinase [Elusimicrobia bacterium RIFOXYC2_FULL_34_12]|nr:MAG: galactokinase [Elusimicrobia bacterium RIFOXYC2_FULL_34_12]